jgi:putative membrane protein
MKGLNYLNKYVVTGIVFTVGLIGLSIPSSRPLFIQLVPLNFLFLIFMFIYSIKKWTFQFFAFSLTVFVAGFLLEVLGIKTGFIFGNYFYGNTLGFKIWDVPVVMGINWIIVLLGAIYWANYILNNLSINPFLKKALVILLSSLLMTGLDYFIEPIAISLDFWHWEGNLIPLRNYFGWLVISILFNIFAITLNKMKINFFSGYLFLIQLIFFLILNITLY